MLRTLLHILALIVAVGTPLLGGCYPTSGGDPSPTPAQQPIQVERHLELDYNDAPSVTVEGVEYVFGSAIWKGVQPNGDAFEFYTETGDGWLVLEGWNFHPELLTVAIGDAASNAWPNVQFAPYVEYDGSYIYIYMDGWRENWLASYDALPSELKVGITFYMPVHYGYFPSDYSQAGYRLHDKGGSTVTWPYNCGALFPCWPSYNVGITWDIGNVPGDPSHTKIYAQSITEPVAQYMLAWTHADYVAESTGPNTALYTYLGDQRLQPLAEFMEAELDILKNYLGEYPFGRTHEGYEYGIAQVEWGDSQGNGGGGMEHHPVTHVDGDVVSQTDPTKNSLAAHEACHAWFSTTIRYGCPEDFPLSEAVCQWVGITGHGMAMGGDSLESQWSYANRVLDWYIDNERESALSWPTTCGEVPVEELFNNSAVYYRGAIMFYWYARAIGGDEALFTLFGEYHNAAEGTAQYFENMLAFMYERTGIDPMRYAERALRNLDDPRPDLEAYATEDAAARRMNEAQCTAIPWSECSGAWWYTHANNPKNWD